MDFTINKYNSLLKSIQSQGLFVQTFADYIQKPLKSCLILRHDVDKHPENSLEFAKIQKSFGIMGTYYFRITSESFNKRIIVEIAKLGHEIGYHYETIDTIARKVKNQKQKYTYQDLIDAAYAEFCRNLETFRRSVTIKTISMHGSPMSPYDNREIWKKYDYKKLGIIAEPYFGLNFNQIYYITDTGRRWDGHLYNVRDKATKENPVTNPDFLKLQYHSTQDIINAVNQGTFPKQSMLNFHPQRWTNKPFPWLKELCWQNVKNQGKRLLIKIR